jgi:hypothetical protein
MTRDLRERLAGVVRDLQRIFADRLEAVVAYGLPPHEPAPSLALVRSLAMEDLEAMAIAAPGWRHDGAATPLVIPRDEFVRSLDAFPIEYGEIIATHVTVHGADPFEGLAVNPLDVRRAIEVQATSHLLHLRENYIELGARRAEIDALVRESAPAFAGLLRRMAHLDGMPAGTAGALSHWAVNRAGLDARVVGDLLALDGDTTATVDAVRLFPAYLGTVTALLRVIDRWRTS